MSSKFQVQITGLELGTVKGALEIYIEDYCFKQQRYKKIKSIGVAIEWQYKKR